MDKLTKAASHICPLCDEKKVIFKRVKTKTFLREEKTVFIAFCRDCGDLGIESKSLNDLILLWNSMITTNEIEPTKNSPENPAVEPIKGSSNHEEN